MLLIVALKHLHQLCAGEMSPVLHVNVKVLHQALPATF